MVCFSNDFNNIADDPPHFYIERQGARPLMDIGTNQLASSQEPQALPRELEAAIQKHDLRQWKLEQREGWGSTTGGKAITQRYLGTLQAAVEAAILNTTSRSDAAETSMLRVLLKLDSSVIALCILQTSLHSLARQEDQRDTSLAIGAALAGECWAAGLTTHSTKLAKAIAKRVKTSHTSITYRKAAAKALAAKEGFKQRDWSAPLKVRAGTWGLNILTEALSDIFHWRVMDDGCTKQLDITDATWATVDAVLHQTITQHPVFFPSVTPPKPWDAWSGCGSNDPRVNSVVTFLRSRHKDTQAAVRHAIKEGSMQPALDGVNALQGVAWTLNTKVLEVIEQCYALGLETKGLVSINPILDLPRSTDEEWEALDEGQRKLKRMQKDELRILSRAAVADRVMLSEDLATARELSKVERFYTPMNCDWRGRVYALPHFNFAREDRVRALFKFADGAPIGEEGLYWLKVHLANCGDFNKISKRPLKERVEWVDENLTSILSAAASPIQTHTWWSQADKPFLFMAACMELASALDDPSSFVTTLPVSFDGSCSGLQHLSAMTRASEGSFVNLTPSPMPQDIYEAVAAITLERITLDLDAEPESISDEHVKAAKTKREIAALAIAYGIDRKLVKRNVMTYAYSSKKYGMSLQLQTDLMKPLGREVLEGKIGEHPFAPFEQGSDERPSAAARYLAGHIFEAIETKVRKPSEAMKYLQKLAKAMAHEGKPLCWTTPVGIPWINRYHDSEVQRVELWLNDGGVRVRSRITVAVGQKNEINKDKASNGVAPNFVHALDAAHLLSVARAANAEGIVNIATVHDSFGCLASQAGRFNQIIREEFALMYETHDVLTEVLERASCDLTHADCDRLPIAIIPGPLNLKDILNADFAFA